jgi:hypothetical protein
MNAPAPLTALAASSLLALATSCEAPQRMALPVMVSVVVRLDDGAYASMLVDLESPGTRPSLRVAQGLISYDGERLIRVSPSTRPTAQGALVHELEVGDLLRGASFSVRLPIEGLPGERLEVVHLREREGGTRSWWEIGLFNGELERLEQASAVDRYERFGPERGFAVYRSDDRVMLSLPHGVQGEGMPLLDHVEGLVGVGWIAEEHFAHSGADVLDRRFKMSGSVTAMAQPAQPDGDLREWSHDQALSVGTASHVETGLVSWSGPRDASFALAARLTPQRLCVAVRIRDEAIVPDADRLVIQTELRRFDLPVPARPGPISVDGLEGAFTDQASFGVGLELCLAPETWTVEEGSIPFRVLFEDHDPDQEPTVLASAPDIPWPTLAGVRLPRRAQDGVPPPKK